MSKIIKKHSSFISWVLAPSLLLVLSVFGVNMISRPALTVLNNTCSVDSDCTGGALVCAPEFCSLFAAAALGECKLASYNSTDNTCLNCDVCGNGRCEPGAPTPENSASCPADCLGVSVTGAPFDKCALTQGNCSGTSLDECCNIGCQGSNPAGTSFDADCCGNLCGDGLIDQASETCDGTAVKTGLTPPASGNSCRGPNVTDPCTYCGDGIKQASEACDPTATAASCPSGQTCNANCACIPSGGVCGNGIVEAGETCEKPGDACSGLTDNDGDPVPGICSSTCQCIPNCVLEGSGCGDNDEDPALCAATMSGGTSLIPLPVHPTVLAQWIAAFAVPGTVFAGLRMRRKKK